MDSLFLAPWRDLAIILLVIEAAVIVAVPGVALYFALKGVRAVKRWLRTPLLQAQVWALRIQQGTTKTANKIASVPISVTTTRVRVTTTARSLFDYVIGR